jgi:glycerophosphoryl diester phosphodiesterase
MVVINVIPPKKNVENNPFVVGKDELPMIAAHRGGSDNNPENTTLACLQIPTSYDLGIEIYLDSKSLIDRAHRRNIAVQYWTINDADEMRELIELGCDCIMTDNPKLLKEVLEEYKK